MFRGLGISGLGVSGLGFQFGVLGFRGSGLSFNLRSLGFRVHLAESSPEPSFDRLGPRPVPGHARGLHVEAAKLQ